MNEAKSTEDFERIRKEHEEKVRNPNTNQNPVPWYVSQGRHFMGFGKQLPSTVKGEK
jgi:hypothetical protein